MPIWLINSLMVVNTLLLLIALVLLLLILVQLEAEWREEEKK